MAGDYEGDSINYTGNNKGKKIKILQINFISQSQVCVFKFNSKEVKICQLHLKLSDTGEFPEQVPCRGVKT